MRNVIQKFMRSSLRTLAVAATLSLAGTAFTAAHAQSVVLDFETRPALPVQPSIFDAIPVQTYSEAGIYSITGGVVLGNPVSLPAFPLHGSGPNLYGTADFGDPSLLDTITLTLPGMTPVVFVGGVLFNGQPIGETYMVSYFSGADGLTPLATQNYGIVAGSSDSAFANFAYTASLANPITRVTISTPNAATNGWDFFVDTVTISPIPEPSQGVLAGVGLAALLLMRRKATNERFF